MIIFFDNLYMNYFYYRTIDINISKYIFLDSLFF